jgi:hypothetical protein
MDDDANACDGTVLTPHTTLWLPDHDGYKRSPLWGVHVFDLLDAPACQHLIDLAEAHGAANGWATGRHKHFPTTDIAVTAETAPELNDALRPHVIDALVLPTLAAYYGHFDARAELSISDVFLVRYAAEDGATRGAPAQDRLAFHRDGSLLSFSILLSDPADFDGGGLRFHSLGPGCEACRGLPCAGDTCVACIAAAAAAAAVASADASSDSSVVSAEAYREAAAAAAVRLCARCGGVGRASISVGRGNLTTHCGKLLHEGARVLRGTRYLLVGFVRVKSPRIDHEFVERSVYANSASRGGESDREIVEEAYDQTGGRWPSQRWGRGASGCPRASRRLLDGAAA